MTLTLEPTYSIDLELVGTSDSISLVEADSMGLSLSPALRGEQGETGIGLLGYNEVTDAATIEVDLEDPFGVYVVTLEGDRTLSFINGSAEFDRKRFILEVTQGTGGGHTLTPDSSVGLGFDLPAIELSTAQGVTDALGFIYRHAAGKTYLLAINHGA